MVVADQGPICRVEPISTMLIRTVVTAFTIMTAFNIRDLTTQCITAVAPESVTTRLMFSLVVTVFFLLATVLSAYFWQEHISS
jgi:uncharacterized membrane protein